MTPEQRVILDDMVQGITHHYTKDREVLAEALAEFDRLQARVDPAALALAYESERAKESWETGPWASDKGEREATARAMTRALAALFSAPGEEPA